MHDYGIEFNEKSADLILPYLKRIYDFNSIVDVGCGIGTWLNSAKKNGVKHIHGLDGSHVFDSGKLLLSANEFTAVDFNFSIDSFKFPKYDLAICLEVLEHIDEKHSNSLLDLLNRLSDVILFSAAIPGQTGQNHVNEQYTDYWVKKFEKHDYLFLDPFRDYFWNNKDVEWWYRQNMFLVVRKDLLLTNFQNTPKWNGKNYVIPELLEMYTQFYKTKNVEFLPIPKKNHIKLFSSYLKKNGFKFRM